MNHVNKHLVSPTCTKLDLKPLDLLRSYTTNIIADSGTNITLVTDNIALQNERKSLDPNPISASKNSIQVTSMGEMNVGPLQITAKRADINEPLLALGDYARKQFITILDDQGIFITKKRDVHIIYNKPPPITGTFDCDNIWRIPIPTKAEITTHKPPTSKSLCYNAYEQKTKKDLARFLHGCAGFPSHSTWIKAITHPNYYTTWPGLTTQLITKHLDKQLPTVMGHMTNIRTGIRSTKKLQYK